MGNHASAARTARLVVEEPMVQGAARILTSAGEDRTSIAELTGDWIAAQDQAEREFQRYEVAARAAMDLYPDQPEGVRQPGTDGRMGRWVIPDAAWPSWRVAAHERWEAQCKAIDSSFGVPGLDKASDAAFVAASRIAEMIAARTPRTAQEAAYKFGVLLKHYGDGQGGIDDPAPIRAFLADLEHLATLENGRR